MAHKFKIQNPPKIPSRVSPYFISYTLSGKQNLSEIKEGVKKLFDSNKEDYRNRNNDDWHRLVIPTNDDAYNFEIDYGYYDDTPEMLCEVYLNWNEDHYNGVIMKDYKDKLQKYEQWKVDNKQAIKDELERQERVNKRRKEVNQMKRMKELEEKKKKLMEELEKVEDKLNAD